MNLKALEKAVKNLDPEEKKKFLRDLPAILYTPDELLRLNAAEKTFAFWDNPEDAVYDNL